MKKTKVKMNKPIYLDMSILDISKTFMYKSWDEYIKPKYGDKVKLCYTDTGSFIIHIITEDFLKIFLMMLQNGMIHLWQYCKDIPAVNDDGDIVDFDGANATDSFNFNSKIIGKTNDDEDIENDEIMVPLKYLSNFWKTLEIALINCEVELILTWSRDCVIIYTNVDDQVPTFTITETNLYVPIVTLSTQDNSKLLLQLKSGFKRTISWNKYLSKPELFAQNANLNHLIEPSFQGVTRLFVLAFENDAQVTSKKNIFQM